ncbi:MAG TPA: tetratricopeptide repeat protein [Syntrophales bacterium]|nr:tetratricopeptide repeat protein [Syntrophales bacterium]
MKRNYLVLIICFILAITSIAVFWQVRNHEFITFDDSDYVTENRYVQDGITLKGIVWAFSEPHAHNWHPLTWLSHMLDCQLFGLKPGLHHLVNVLFHVANSILLFLVLYKMTNTLWQSAFVAGLFALHPFHVESVAWAAERKDVLSTFFWMLTMGAYVYYVERPGYKRYVFVLLFFVLGLMAKPMLVTLPFVLLLLDFWPLKRLRLLADAHVGVAAPQPARSAKKKKKSKPQPQKDTMQKKAIKARTLWSEIRPLLQEKTPFIIITIALCFVTIYAQHRIVRPMALYPMDCRIANALISYVTYIGKMLWPVKLSVFYPYGTATMFSWQAAAATVLLLFATYLAVRAAGHFPYLVVGWLWYLGTLVPVIGLVQVGLQSMADRYTYIPLIGIFIVISWGAPELLRRWHYRKFALAGVAVGVLFCLAVLTYIQVGYWRNNIVLYEHAIEVTSENAWAQNNLGYALSLQGKKDEAIGHFRKAINIGNEADAHYNLGTVLASQGKLDEAIYQFRESIRISPAYAKAHNNLGNALLYQGRIDEAIVSYREALRLNPEYVIAQENLKNTLAVQKKLR